MGYPAPSSTQTVPPPQPPLPQLPPSYAHRLHNAPLPLHCDLGDSTYRTPYYYPVPAAVYLPQPRPCQEFEQVPDTEKHWGHFSIGLLTTTLFSFFGLFGLLCIDYASAKRWYFIGCSIGVLVNLAIIAIAVGVYSHNF